jgi:hypothetical protein
VPLAEIKTIVGLEPAAAAQRINELWAAAETEHAARRALAAFLVDRLNGKRSVMYEVDVREMPSRSLLCLKRSVPGEKAAWALGKEFMGLMREHQLPRVDGSAGAAFCIYWGEVSDDSDGPVEWCRPIPDDRAQALAADCPGLTLRSEPAHREAFVDVGPAGQLSTAEWQLVSESLRAWVLEHDARPVDLGVRLGFNWTPPITDTTVPDCDFAVPMA